LPPTERAPTTNVCPERITIPDPLVKETSPMMSHRTRS
jgi:hypothetical protein